MAEREIVSLVWDESAHQIEVSYVEHLIGSDVVAAVLAGDAGLQFMPTADDAFRWVRGTEVCRSSDAVP
jgi:hypothetical protein